MVKKIIIATSFFITSITLVVLSLITLPKLATSNTTEGIIYENSISIYELQNREDKKLNIEHEDKKEKLKRVDFIASSTKLYETETVNSLLNYFYFHTQTKNPLAVYSTSDVVSGVGFADLKISELLLQKRDEIDEGFQNAKLIIEEGRAIEFAPEKNGERINLPATVHKIKTATVSNAESSAPLVTHETPAPIRLAELNSQGINKLIGQGVSDFSGSSAARIHNIKVGAARYDGLILKPGEVFSFNDHLGPVTAQAGFLPELVIKAEGTVPEFGGGLCQVSSTAFRAAFFTGTQIDERKNHSYAVKYYKWIDEDIPATEGMDATIYPGVVDMKFTNDTQGAILISTYIENRRLYFDFYGTPDGREVELAELRAYDRQPTGAVKSKVVRKVTKDGQTSEDTFYSSYVSPDKFPRTYEYADAEDKENSNSSEKEQNNQTIIN